KDFIVAYSAGNNGSAVQTISPSSSAKNVIAVGSHSELSPNTVTNTSSRGPTEDGRWGITICAPGETVMSVNGGTSGAGSDYVDAGGTSMACPFAAGATALIRDWLKQGFYPSGTKQSTNAVVNPSSALLRALIINGAEDMGQIVPNTNIGFGRMRLDNVCFMNDVSPKAIALHDAQDGLLDGEYVEYQFNVTANAVDLKVSLVWTDYPYPFTGYNNVMQDTVIMNDLDLIVTSPSAIPFNLNDHLNTLEQHIFVTPETGVWTVRVYGYDVVVSPQPYALVVTYDVDNAFNGNVMFDKAVYSAIDSIATITVADNSDDLINVDVKLYSMVGDTETITCTGTTGLFKGTIEMAYSLNVIDDGILAITSKDTIFAEYYDASAAATLKAMATTDGELFTVYNVHTEAVEGTRAFIAWNTTEVATGKVYYGETTGLGSETAIDPNLVTDHSGNFAIVLTSLTANTIYYYDVESVDHKGNTVRDDNSGKHYSFATVDMSSTDILVLVTDNDLEGELFAHPEFLVDAIEGGGWTYSWWQTSINNLGKIPVDNLLKGYKAIFLQSGQENYPPINDDQQDSLERYEQGGGRIAFTGHDFGWAMASTDGFSYVGTDIADSMFVINYMMGAYDGDIIETGNFTLYGVTSDPISGDYTAGVVYNPFRWGADGDSLTGISNAFVNGTSSDVWRWDNAAGWPCGVKWESQNTQGSGGDGVWGGYRTRTIFNAFEITQIDTVNDPSAIRSDILNKNLIWLIGHNHPYTTLLAPTGGENFSTSPVSISWTDSADVAVGAYIDSVFLYYSPNGGDVWYEITKGTAVEVTSPYSWNVSSLLNGNDYKIKVKVVDGGVYPSMGGLDESDIFTINITGNDTEGPVVYAGSVKPSINPVANSSGFVPASVFTLTAIICDSITGLSNIGAAEWSYGIAAAPAGTGHAMTAADGNFDELYENVTTTVTVTDTFPLGDVLFWVRGRDSSPSKSPNNWGSAVSTTVTILETTTYSGIKLVSFAALTG
ncbi:S8 family serine peptidase, partial [candidate division WOR-3 bacterium]|nr:S8 family serine peptidase [candidate division WOR-3 bacterium]